MIQFNLLPDVKSEYLKISRQKRVIILISIVITVVSLLIVGILFSVVTIVQRNTMDTLDASIKEKTSKLTSNPDINKILTVQNQLNTIQSIHDKKPSADRLFQYVVKITPENVSHEKFSVDFNAQTMTFSGTSKKLEIVNKFVDTLKFTKVKGEKIIGDKIEIVEERNAFSSVVLDSYTVTDSDAAKSSYSISLKYDPIMFDGSISNIQLVVPNITTTRSVTERPEGLFVEEKKDN